MMSVRNFNLATSTATIAIFDEDCLNHRLNDPADWWADFMEEIVEVNAGNAVIVGLTTDGVYNVNVTTGEDPANLLPDQFVVGVLRNSSGRLYIGPGEEIVGGGYKPSTLRHPTGMFVDLREGTYRVQVSKNNEDTLSVEISSADGDAKNSIEEQLLLEN